MLSIFIVGGLGLLHSENFTTNTLLPFISKKTSVPIEAKSVRLEKFSTLHAKELKVGPTDGFTFSSKTSLLKINLLSLFSRNINIETIKLDEPYVEINPENPNDSIISESSQNESSQSEPANSEPAIGTKEERPNGFGFSISLNDGKISKGEFNLKNVAQTISLKGVDLDLKAELDKQVAPTTISGGILATEGELHFNDGSESIALRDLGLELEGALDQQTRSTTASGKVFAKELKAKALSKAIGLDSKFDLTAKNQDIEIKELVIDVEESENKFLNLSVAGNLTQDLTSKESVLTINSEKIALSTLFEILGVDVSPPKAKDSSSKEAKKQEEKTSKQLDTSIEPEIVLPDFLKKLWLIVDLNLKEVSFEDIVVKNGNGILKAKESNFAVENLLLQNKDSKLNASAKINLASQLPVFELNADTNLIKVADINEKLTLDSDRNLSGEIQDLKLALSGQGLSQKSLEENLLVDFSTKLKEIDFDQRLEFVIPFNLIFLPFTTLAKINELNPLGSLPKPVLGPLEEIITALEDLTKLNCKKGKVNVTKKGSNLIFKEATFEMSVVIPDLKIPGTVGVDGEIEINSELGLLGLWIPMPLAGTVDLPYPDIPVFVQELTLGIIGAPVKLIGDLVSGDEDEKGEEEEEPSL